MNTSVECARELHAPPGPRLHLSGAFVSCIICLLALSEEGRCAWLLPCPALPHPSQPFNNPFPSHPHLHVLPRAITIVLTSPDPTLKIPNPPSSPPISSPLPTLLFSPVHPLTTRPAAPLPTSSDAGRDSFEMRRTSVLVRTSRLRWSRGGCGRVCQFVSLTQLEESERLNKQVRE